MNRSIFSVEQINNYAKGLFDRDPLLQNIWIRGEISNFKLHSSGHMYFTLKDSQARIRCVFFKYYAKDLPFIPTDGLKVILGGNVSIYTKDGQFQFYVENMEEDGTGRLYAAFEALKAKLAEEGLFNEEFKQALPPYPKKIGIITSHTGAAVHDIIKVISKRNKLVDLLVIPVAVQGEMAKDQISSAIRYANTREDLDLLIVGRGGGSIEELWAFNEEKVARAIFESKIPIISAVGHETDFTLSDFVSDIRAATPSAAGEIAVADLSDTYGGLSRLTLMLNNSINIYLKNLDISLENLANNYILKYPERFLLSEEQRLDYSLERLTANITGLFTSKENRFYNLISYLEALNPLSIMVRGYCILSDRHNKDLINSIDQLYEGIDINVRLKDGRAQGNIINISKKPEGNYEGNR